MLIIGFILGLILGDVGLTDGKRVGEDGIALGVTVG